MFKLFQKWYDIEYSPFEISAEENFEDKQTEIARIWHCH